MAELLEALLRDFHGERRYWDKRDCLNSDGRRLLHAATKKLLEEKPCLRRIAAEARRNPCVEELDRLLEAALEATC